MVKSFSMADFEDERKAYETGRTRLYTLYLVCQKCSSLAGQPRLRLLTIQSPITKSLWHFTFY